METPVVAPAAIVTTTSSSAVATNTENSPLIGLPPELLFTVTDHLPLRDQLNLRGPVGNCHLFDLLTQQLATKRRLCLDIVYPPLGLQSSMAKDNPLPTFLQEKEEVKEKAAAPNPLNGLFRRQLDLWRDALRSVADRQLLFSATERRNGRSGGMLKLQQQQEKEKDETKPNFSSSSSLSLYEVAHDKVLAKNEIIFEDLNWEHSYGYNRSMVGTFRRDYGFRPWLLPSLTDLEVRSFPHLTETYLKLVPAALAALLYSPDYIKSDEKEEEKDYRPIQLTSFALYTLSFVSNNSFMSFFARFWKILSTSATPVALAPASTVVAVADELPSNNSTASTSTLKTSTSTSTPKATLTSSLNTLKSLTFFGRKQLRPTSKTDVKNYWGEAMIFFNLIDTEPVFPAVEELVLGGVEGGLLEWLLSSGTVFPALRRLVLVFYSCDDDHHYPFNEMMLMIERSGFAEVVRSGLSEERRRQLTHLSVYSFDQLLARHKRALKRQEKEKEKFNKKNDRENEKEEKREEEELVAATEEYDNEVELKKHLLYRGSSYGALVAFIREHFPSVVSFNGQAMPSWTTVPTSAINQPQ